MKKSNRQRIVKKLTLLEKLLFRTVESIKTDFEDKIIRCSRGLRRVE